MLLHRYKFESNSQLLLSATVQETRCLCLSLDTSLKAIHNDVLMRIYPDMMLMLLHRNNDFKDQ